MTSLQKQLASIAASTSHELDLKAQKSAHSKSLLFEPKVAAGQSMESVYQICLEGYQDLCQLDGRFNRYRSNIFGSQSVREDRNRMTKNENNDLNVVLESFLGLIGARLLLKSALKSVEWLVRRFSVHEHNTESLIIAFLPYHNSQIFVPLLTILPKQLPPSFKFLYPYMSSLANPARPVLVQAATNNIGFFNALNRYVLNAAKAHHQHSILLALWASILVQSIDGKLASSLAGRMEVQKQRQEDILIQVLPVLNEALTTKNAPELALGCFMIVTVLAHKVDLDDKVIDALMVAITSSVTPDIVDDALACVAILAERRQSINLPKVAARAILKVDRLEHRLEQLRLIQPLERLSLSLALETLNWIASGKTLASPALVEHIVSGGLVGTQYCAVLRERCNSLLAEPSVGQSGQEDLNAISKIINSAYLTTEPLEDSDAMSTDESDTVMGALEDAPLSRALTQEDSDEAEHNSFIQLLSTVEASSLLLPDTTVAFNQLNDSYSKCMLTLEKKPIAYARSSKSATVLLTFLMRVWTTERSASAKQIALRIMINEISVTGLAPSELEMIIPYVLVALSDRAKSVRRSAATLMVAISRLQNEKQNASVKSQGFNVYGPTKTVEPLSDKDVSALVQTGLLPDMEECIVDPQRIARTLQQCLDDSVKQQAGRDPMKLKTSQKEAIFAFLSGHLRETALPAVKTCLLSMLNMIDKVGKHRRSTYLLPVLKMWATSVSHEEAEISVSAAQDLRIQFLASVHSSDVEAVTYLLDLALGKVTTSRAGLQGAAFERLIEIWSSLKEARQKKIAESLVRASLFVEDDEVSQVAKVESSSFLRAVRVPAEVFVMVMGEALEDMEPVGRPSSAKKRRLEAGTSVDTGIVAPESIKAALSKLTFVLELVDTSSHASQSELVSSLFKLLRSIQGLRRSSAADLSYIQSMALGSLNAVMAQSEASKSVEFDKTIAYADLLVDTVRNTANTEVRNSALLLLSRLAKTAPQVILHSVMPIFTLMSTSTIRQSDDFSAHIVDQTIQRVIPLLAESLKRQKKDLISAVAEVLLSFASAYDHIPPHRRLHLFTLLASSLGAEDSLFAVIVALVDRFPGNNGVYRFTAQLLRQFSTTEMLVTIQKYVGFICQCFDKGSSAWKVLLKGNSGDEYQNKALQELLSVLPLLLVDESFQSKVKADMRSTGDISQTLAVVFGDILRDSINLLRALDQRKLDRTTCARAVTHLLNLLPFDQLIRVAEPLLEDEDQDLCRSMLKALDGRIRLSGKVDSASVEATIAFLPRLTAILQRGATAGLKHSAVACIDRISEKFGKTNLDAIAGATQVVASAHCLGSGDKLLRILSLHCLASSVEILGNDFIPLLQISSQAAFACLEESLAQGQEDQKLHNAAYSFFIAVIDKIPFVLSQASLKKLVELSHLSAARDLGSEGEGNRSHMYQIAATKLDLKAVINVASSEWVSAVKQGPTGLHEHIGFLRTAVNYRSKADVSSNFRALSEFFLLSSDLRRSIAEDDLLKGSYTDGEVQQLEGKNLDAIMATVLKVNDAVFRPFFLRFSQWCAPASPESSVYRSITFFNFLSLFSERLKSIVTSYFGYVIERAAELLTEIHSNKRDLGHTLQGSVLAAITSSFKHDQDDFWQAPSHFNVMLPAMIAHLEASTSNQPRATAAMDALIELAGAATASPDNLKALSGALLRLARSDSIRVRLAAVKCEQALTQRVGDDWLGLLPEMLPVINELQDDDDEVVEKETHKWIKMIEATLGESLDSMLQ